MPTYCCVPNCSNRGGFKFPNDKELNLAWRVAIKRIDEKKRLWRPKKSSKVCILHFKKDDFKEIDIETIGGAWKRKNLKSRAVPSIFAHSAELSESNQNRRQRQREREKLKRKEEKVSPQDKLTKCFPSEIDSAPTNFFSDDIGLQETEIGSTENETGKNCIIFLIFLIGFSQKKCYVLFYGPMNCVICGERLVYFDIIQSNLS